MLKPEKENYKKENNEIQHYRGDGRKQSRLYKPAAEKKTKLYLEPQSGQITTSARVIVIITS